MSNSERRRESPSLDGRQVLSDRVDLVDGRAAVEQRLGRLLDLREEIGRAHV